MFNKTIDYLNLRQAGGIELFFAFIMILSAYSFMGVPLKDFLSVILFIYLFFKKKRVGIQTYYPLITLTIYILIHDFIYLLIANGNLYAYITQISFLGCIIMAIKVFKIEKLKASLNLVAIISIIGILYQWGIIISGSEVHPIQIPFLEMPHNRLETSVRPSSFFMEPAAYVAYMYIPLAFSLIDKKYIWSIILILSEFLSTSTTGLLTSFIMIIAYLFTQKISFKIKLLVILIGASMAYSLIFVKAFQASVDKLENTEIDNNVRLAQGAYIVSTMKFEEMFLGAPYHSAYDYCTDGRAPDVIFYDKAVYMSTVWMLILKYGFVGLFFYLLLYYKIVRKNKQMIPLVICLLIVMFSSSYGIGLIFVYTLIPMLLVTYKLESSKKSYVAIYNSSVIEH